MRLLLSSLLILCVQLAVFSQVSYDEVKIYLHPEYLTLGISDDCVGNENHTRVFASVKISILNKNEILEIENILLREKLFSSESQGDHFQSQMVIDFIFRGRIKKTVAISSSNRVRIDESEDEYKLHGETKVFFNKYLRFFREVQINSN